MLPKSMMNGDELNGFKSLPCLLLHFSVVLGFLFALLSFSVKYKMLMWLRDYDAVCV